MAIGGQRRLRGLLPAIFVFVLGALITLLGWMGFRTGEREEERLRFSREVAERENVIIGRLARLEALLEGARAYFGASSMVEAAEWRSYVRGVSPAREHPYVCAVGFAEYLDHYRRGGSDSERIVYLEAVEGHDSRPALAQAELLADSSFVENLADSAALDEVHIAEISVGLAHHAEDSGYLLFLTLDCLEKLRRDTATPAGECCPSPIGNFFVEFDAGELFRVNDPGSGNVLEARLESTRPLHGEAGAFVGTYRQIDGSTAVKEFQFGDRVWTVSYRALAPIGRRWRGNSDFIIPAGLFVSLLLSFLYAGLVERRLHAEALNADLVRANEKLREVDRLKSEFVATVSHELRTPAALFLGGTEVLERSARAAGDAKIAHIAEVTRRNAKRLVRLVENLLDASTIEAGQLKLQHEEIIVGNSLTWAIDNIEGLAREKNVVIERDIAPCEIRMRADLARFGQIVTNLLDNAIRFAESRVTVRLAVESDQVVVRVLDDGPGIPPDQVGNVFNRFVQIRGHIGKRRTGLGLSITKAVVEAHGGTIEVANRETGGTVFTVRFPQSGQTPR